MMADLFEFGGATFQQAGRFITSESHRTPEQQREIILRMSESVPKLEASIRSKNEEIAAILRTHDPLDVIVNLALACHPLVTAPLEDIYTPNVEPMCVEHVALLALRCPYCQTPMLLDAKPTEKLTEILRALRSDTTWLSVARSAKRLSDNPALDASLEELCAQVRDNELFVRGKAYPWDCVSVMSALFEPAAERLKHDVGFLPEEALRIAEAVPHVAFEKIRQRRNAARPFESDLRRHVQCAMAGTVTDDLDDEMKALVTSLASASSAERDLMIRNMVCSWVFLGLGRTMPCTAAEISAYTSLSEQAVTNFLQHFSVKFGDVPAEYAFPTVRNPLRRRPFIENDGRYFAPSIGLILPAVQLGIEEHIKQTGGQDWERYQKNRHRFTLRKTADLIQSMIPGCFVAHELEYHMQGAQSPCELDGLVQCGSVLFLIEVKGGGLSEAARSGDDRRLSTQVEELIGKAHEQVVRALEYILATSEAEFVIRGSGQTLMVRRSDITSVFPMTVTLEPLGALTCAINAASRLPFLKGDMTQLPWMVSLYDLMPMADLLDGPFLFPHYVKSRVRLNDEGIAQGFDELDFVGEYFHSGLAYEGSGTVLQIGTMTHEIDAYLYFKHGVRPQRVKKPKPVIAPELRKILSKLSLSPSPHRVEVAMALLDMPVDIQRDFSRAFETCVKKAQRDGRAHNLTQVYRHGNGWGITCLCCEQDVERRMKEYADRKLREHQVAAWYVIGRSPRRRAPLFAFALKNPSERHP